MFHHTVDRGLIVTVNCHMCARRTHPFHHQPYKEGPRSLQVRVCDGAIGFFVSCESSQDVLRPLEVPEKRLGGGIPHVWCDVVSSKPHSACTLAGGIMVSLCNRVSREEFEDACWAVSNV